MSDLTTTITGLDRIVRNLNNSRAIVAPELTAMVNEVTRSGAKVSQGLAPVDTGALRASIHAVAATSGGGVARGSWQPSVPYAVFVELGHRTRGGRSVVAGRFFMRDAARQIRPMLVRLGRDTARRIAARVVGYGSGA